MKKKIHPEYKETTIVCACGEVIHTRSTKQNIKVDVCSKCHPFFTGQQKLVDSAGRVEKFKRRYAAKKTETNIKYNAVLGLINRIRLTGSVQAINKKRGLSRMMSSPMQQLTK